MILDAAWDKACDVIAGNDLHGRCVFGLDAPIDALQASTNSADFTRPWMAGTMTNDVAVTRMAEASAGLCAAWDKAHAG